MIYSLMTDYRFGATKVLTFRQHLVIDTLAAVGLALVPFFLGFHGLDAWFYWSNSAALFLVIGLSPARNSDEAPAMAHA